MGTVTGLSTKYLTLKNFIFIHLLSLIYAWFVSLTHIDLKSKNTKAKYKNVGCVIFTFPSMLPPKTV